MKKAILLSAGLLAGFAASAQISITGSTLTYNQDFNTLETGTTASDVLPFGWAIAEFGTSAANDDKYKGNDGSSNAGDTYSYGTTGSSERALGSLTSNSLTPTYGAMFTNNTGAAITGFTLSYTGEQWRLGNTAEHLDSLVFQYSVTATGVGDSGVLALWMDVPSLMFNSAVTSGTTAGPLDGNDPANRTNVTGTVTFLVPVPDGSSFVVRWVDTSIAGADDGLAIDDVTFTFNTATPPPVTYNPVVVSTDPADNATSVPVTTNPTVVFDRNVTAGTGSIYLHNSTTGGVQSFPATSPDVMVTGNTVTITGASLAADNDYYILMDSTAFDTAGYRIAGIYDSTQWNFSTSVVASVASVGGAKAPLAVLGVPANGNITLGFTLQHAGNLTIEVMDLNGRILRQAGINAQAGKQQYQISNLNLAAGTYIVRISNGKESGVVKTTLR